MYQYDSDKDGIYVVINGEEYQLQYDSPSVIASTPKCAKCDFFNGSCQACESFLRIESQFPDSYWKRTNSKYVLCDGDANRHAVATNSNAEHGDDYPYTTDFATMTYTVGGEFEF